MGLHCAHLSLVEQRTIFRLLQERQSVGSIAMLLGRHRSTIQREIARNFHHSPVRDRWGHPERGYLRPGFRVPGLPHAASAGVFLRPAEPLAEGRGGECQRRLRRHLPLDSAPEQHSPGALSLLAQRLNSTPRKCLGYRTPAEVFAAQLETLSRNR